MGLRKAEDPNIDPKAPWVNDDLRREREGLVLTRLIESLTGSYVIAIKGDWGSGKSVFLRRLSASLESNGIPVVPVDSWRTDYLEDPLIAFVAATEQRIGAERSRSPNRVEAGKVIAKRLAKYAGKLSPSLAGVIADHAVPGSGVAATAVAESARSTGEALLDAIKEKRNAEQNFRANLAEARDFLTKRPKTRPITRPIVVAIDELDRCRPNYAVKVLERIKHYFDVPGVVFVIATDGKNLPNAVASVYGDKIDGELYLRKFFDYEFDLKDPDPDDFVQVLATQFEFNALIDTSPHDRLALSRMIAEGTDANYWDPVKARDRALDALEIEQAFPFFARNLRLSLRDQAQAFTLINAYLRTVSPNVVIFPRVLAFVYCVRFANPAAYGQLREGAIGLKQLWEVSAGQPPLIPSEWLKRDSAGWDVMFFANAAVDANPLSYVEISRGAALRDSHIDVARLRAVDRLYVRVRTAPTTVSVFLPRAFQLADSFS